MGGMPPAADAVAAAGTADGAASAAGAAGGEVEDEDEDEDELSLRERTAATAAHGAARAAAAAVGTSIPLAGRAAVGTSIPLAGRAAALSGAPSPISLLAGTPPPPGSPAFAALTAGAALPRGLPALPRWTIPQLRSALEVAGAALPPRDAYERDALENLALERGLISRAVTSTSPEVAASAAEGANVSVAAAAAAGAHISASAAPLQVMDFTRGGAREGGRSPASSARMAGSHAQHVPPLLIADHTRDTTRDTTPPGPLGEWPLLIDVPPTDVYANVTPPGSPHGSAPYRAALGSPPPASQSAQRRIERLSRMQQAMPPPSMAWSELYAVAAAAAGSGEHWEPWQGLSQSRSVVSSVDSRVGALMAAAGGTAAVQGGRTKYRPYWADEDDEDEEEDEDEDEDDEDDEESVSRTAHTAPIDVVIAACVEQPIEQTHMWLGHAAVMLMLHEHRLLPLLGALRRFALGGSADFGTALVESLQEDLRKGRSLTSRRHGTLRRALDTALRLSEVDDETGEELAPYAASLALVCAPGEGAELGAGLGGGANAATASGAGRLAASAATSGASPEELRHRIGAFDALRLELPIPAPLDAIINAKAMDQYANLFRLILRVRRAAAALSAIWTTLQHEHKPHDSQGRQGRGDLEEAHAWHLLRLHVHELRHFVNGVQAHFIAYVCGHCYTELESAIVSATSVRELHAAHDAYLQAATSRCLLHAAGLPTASLITAVLALVLSLHREVCTEGALPVGAAWAGLVDASRRQFAMLVSALARQPLTPRELVAHQVHVGLG